MPRTRQPHRRTAAGRMAGTIIALTRGSLIVVDARGRKWAGAAEMFFGETPQVGDRVEFLVEHATHRPPRVAWCTRVSSTPAVERCATVGAPEVK